MLKKLTCYSCLLIAGLLIHPAPSHALISCAPEELTLETDVNEPEYVYVTGEIQTPTQDYSFDFSSASDPNEKAIAFVTLSLSPPEHDLLYKVVSKLPVEEEIFIPDGTRFLVIQVKGDFGWGPDYFIGKIPQPGASTCMKMRMKNQ